MWFRNSRWSPVRHNGFQLLILPLLASSLIATLTATSAYTGSHRSVSRITRGCREATGIPGQTTHGLNDGRAYGGIFQIDGVPKSYEAGKSYPLTVTIGQPGQSQWGFELAARFSESGKQAGSWAVVDSTTEIKNDTGIIRVVQTAEGSRKGEKDGPVVYRIDWRAPSEAGGMVLFSATGNAADDSNTLQPNFMYTAGNFSKPAPPAADEPEPIEVTAIPVKPPMRLQESSHLISLPVPVDRKKGTIEMLIQHRFFQSITDGGASEAFGIDSGANIGLGLTFGLSDRLSVGLSRTRNNKTIAFMGAYELPTAKGSPWKLALLGGVEARQNFHEEYSPYLQLAASVERGPFRVHLVPTMVFNSRPADVLQYYRNDAIHPDNNSTFSLGIGTDLAVNKKLSLIGEYVPRLAGYGGLYQRNDHYGAGVALRTWGHVFTVLVSSSRDLTPALYGVNAGERDVSLGFNIFRRIR